MDKNELSQLVIGTRSGISFFGLLCILFIGLKLTNQVDWSWVWVLSPLWIPWALLIAASFLALMLLGAVLLGGEFYMWCKKRRK